MKRVASIDIMRAITMFLMLMANDAAGVTGLPDWFYHAKANEDMMGFSDLIFPSFLFCVGLSLPFAIEGRFRKGQSTLQVLRHILVRSFALIVMGLFSLNCGGIEGGISGQVFKILMVMGFFMVWNVYPAAEGAKARCYEALKILGALILFGLVVYRYAMGAPIRIGWWGILGLIGWAYLVCALVYLLCRKALGWGLLGWLLIAGCMIAQASGVRIFAFLPGGWTHPTLVFSGVASSMLMSKFGDSSKPGWYIGILCCGALLMAGASALCHNFWICSKIGATPTWAFMCITCYLPILALLFWLCDSRGLTAWAKPLSPAGTATLTCYLLPTVWYSVQQLLGLSYPASLYSGLPGFIKACAIAMLMILLTWLLGKVRIKLKI